MDQERLNEIIKYLGENPATPDAPGGQQVHLHFHQAPVSTAPVDQNPGQTVLEKYTPYFVMFLGGIVIIAGAAVVMMFAFAALATVLLVLLGVIAGLALLGIVGVLLMRSYGESQALRDLAHQQSRKRR